MRICFDIERERSSELYKEITNDNIDGECPFNFHSQIELYFVKEGKVDACVNTHRRLLSKNQMAVALSYDAHLFRSVGNSKSSILIIPTDACPEFTSAVKNKRVENPFITNERVTEEIRRFVDEIKKAPDDKLKTKGYVYLILSKVLENIFLEESPHNTDTELSTKILSFLTQNYRNEITLDSLAATFGYTKSYVSRYFKSCFGIGITRYLNLLRLRGALLILHDGSKTHTYAALECGFNSVRTFYRLFKQEFNTTPTEYLANTNR